MTKEGASNLIPVYILDDDLEVGQTVSAMVDALGFNAHYFSSSDDFFKQLIHHQAEFIFLDLFMPEVDGLDVIQELGQLGSQARIVIMSGYDAGVLKAAKIRASECGLQVAGVLEKPIDFTSLESLLKVSKIKRDYATPKASSASLEAAEVRELIENDAIVVHYQPIVDSRSGEIRGFEALARLQGKENLYFPNSFIELVEENDLMDRLTKDVCTKAITFFAPIWKNNKKLKLSVNLSLSIFEKSDYVAWLVALCNRFDLPTDTMVLEITESAADKNPELTLTALTKLRLSGFYLAIDDFGVAYSSLANLVRYPFTHLKIDRSFLTSLHFVEEKKKIVAIVSALAETLGLYLTSEGVETKDELEFVQQMTCDSIQGYLIAKPLTDSQANEFLSTWKGFGENGLPQTF